MMIVAESTPSRGRPRSAQTDRLIAEAALDVLAELGAEGFTMEAVAARANVAKSTLYRRYAGRTELLAAALTYLREQLPPVPTSGSVRDRLVALLDGIRGQGASSRSGRIMLHVAGQRQGALVDAYYRSVVEPRRMQLLALVAEGVARGEFRSDLAPDVVVALLVGPMIHLRMWAACLPDQPSTVTVVDSVIAGIRSAGTLSG